METRRLIFAILAALGVYLAYTTIYERLFPAPRPGPTTMAVPSPGAEPVPPDQVTTTSPSALPGGGEYSFTAGVSDAVVTLGGRADDALELLLSPRGASVEALKLTSRRKNQYLYRASADGPEPHTLLTPVAAGQRVQRSFSTEQIEIQTARFKRAWRLDDLVWETQEATPDKAVFTATLAAPDAGNLVRVTKSYELRRAVPIFDVRIAVANESNEALSFFLIEDGPTGLPEEGRMWPSRHLFVAFRDPATGALELSTVRPTDLKRGPRAFAPSQPTHKLAWVATANKYFGVFARPMAAAGGPADFVFSVSGELADPTAPNDHHDAFTRLATVRHELAPGKRVEYALEGYAGPKATDVLESVNPAYADRAQVGFVAAQDVDHSCCPCQFQFLTALMIKLLDFAKYVTGNYGIAILILVIIVRTLLHPLSVFQQKSMYRAQDAMARIHPKLEALKERYANDRQRFGQEQMKLFAEEGVNPLAPMVGFLPLLIQTPILIALWNALATDIHLRHAPLDGVWIRDLAAPDALIAFAQPITIPILGWLPLIGAAFSNIPSFNLLPVLMGVAMWLQQKYMPKPGMDARKEALKKAAAARPEPEKAPRGFGQMSPEEQLRQQQMIANMMAIMFPLMFYYQPSGLALYWMFTNVFGICESLIIRKQLKAEKERREREGPKAQQPRTPGVVARLFKRLAEQAEELQKKADELGKPEQVRSSKREREK